jgi:superfamily II DNA or RNA helicase
VTPRKYQLDAADHAAVKDRAGISMCTGSGKSFTMAMLIHKLQMRTLCIVPNLELKRQLQATFLELFGSLDNICVENIASPRLKHETDYEVLILDECHHAASASYRILNRTAWKNIYHRYFFTGTYFRSQESETLLFEGIAGPCCYKFTYQEAVAAKAIVPVEAYYIEIPKVKPKGNIDSWPAMYSELVVNNAARNTLLQRLMYKLHVADKSTITIVKELEHGYALSGDGAFPFANGVDGSTDLIASFNSGETKTLIGTTGVVGEGVDTKPAEFIIIAGLGKSKNSIMQWVGRGLRTYPGKESAKVVLILDKSHKWCRAHYREQAKVLLEEYGVTPVKLDIA